LLLVKKNAFLKKKLISELKCFINELHKNSWLTLQSSFLKTSTLNLTGFMLGDC